MTEHRKRQPVFLLLLFGALMASAAAIFYRPQIGYCKGSAEPFSDAEYIMRAMGYVADKQTPFDSSVLSRERYLAAHPDCCSVRDESPSFVDRILGTANAVTVKLIYDFTTENGVIAKYEQYVDLGYCGNLGNRYGMQI